MEDCPDGRIPPTALTAADVMTADPRTCSPFSTVLEAVMIFRDADCGAVPVLDDGKPVGILTDRDVALALAEHGDDLPTCPVADIMTKGVVSVAPDDPLEPIVETVRRQRRPPAPGHGSPTTSSSASSPGPTSPRMSPSGPSATRSPRSSTRPKKGR